ncbi:UNVERIFIED_CONTAM: hypothetical protein Cloal_0043 [Acetivibrio alkalicellulosi]
MGNKFKMTAYIFTYLLVFLGVQVLTGVILALGYIGISVLALIMSGENISDINMIQFEEDIFRYITEQINVSLIISFVISLVIYYFIFKIRKINILKASGFSKIRVSNIPILVILAISMNIVVSFILSIAMKYMPYNQTFAKYQEMMEELFKGGNTYLLLISIGILAPLLEEIVFRGLIFSELRKNTNIIITILIQALLFGIVHLNPVQSTYAFFLGIFLGFLYVWTKSIWAPVIVHIVFNSFSVISTRLPEVSTLSIPILVAAFVFSIIGTILIILNREKAVQVE